MNLDTQETLAHFAALIDPKVGVIRQVEIVKLSDVDPRVYLAHADPCDTVPLTGIAAANRGAACANDADRAILRACGECVERYCSAFFDFDALLLASQDEMESRGRRCIPARALYPFADWQYDAPGFPYERVPRHQAVRWILGTSIANHEVWIPASCVFVPYRFEAAVEPFTHMPISTGLAAGPSVDSCIEKGLCEIIERDALMVVWNSKMRVPRIDPPSCLGLASEIDELLTSVRSAGTRWLINLLTLDIDIPVISAALVDDGDPPLTSFGIASSSNPVMALMGALEEALMTRLLVNRCRDLISRYDWHASSLRTLWDHLLAHASSTELLSRMRFLTDDGPLIRFENLKWLRERPESVRLACAAAGRDAAWIDVTTPDILDLGSRVVRTLMPGMQPLDNDHEFRHLGGERLLSLPRSLGYPLASYADFNQDPHPFP